ncbi:beta-lactamase/transpeptidase-like protein [Clavulina sp. PMI_390]|nr:beta-lactamase/transpeptidase-like protein [Clavulina sp. PMI_390]
MWAKRHQYSLIALPVLSSLAHVWAAQLPLRPLRANDGNPSSTNTNFPALLDDSFEEWLANLTSIWGLKGLSVAVVRRHDDDGSWHVETKGYGVKNEAGDLVTDETTFAIGSNSKLFTTLALGKLVEGGSTLPGSSLPLKWSTKIADILGDDWQLEDKIAERYADLIDIMSHRSGLPRHDMAWLRGETSGQAVRKLRYLRPSEEFRQGWQYNNFMYMTMAEIVERVSGRPFIQFIQDEIMDKLPFTSATMNSTRARTSGHLADGFVQIRRNVSDGMGVLKSTYEPASFFIDDERENIIAGAGGVTMSAKDVVRAFCAIHFIHMIQFLDVCSNPICRQHGYKPCCCSGITQTPETL